MAQGCAVPATVLDARRAPTIDDSEISINPTLCASANPKLLRAIIAFDSQKALPSYARPPLLARSSHLVTSFGSIMGAIRANIELSGHVASAPCDCTGNPPSMRQKSALRAPLIAAGARLPRPLTKS